MEETLRTTALHDWHTAHQGTMVDFAGWSMPVKYGSIIDEHQATREAIGLFDISHMGRFRFEGPDAQQLLDGLITRRVAGMKDGQIRYGLVTHADGGILDDVLVYSLRDAQNHPYCLLVVNASNREKIWDWITDHFGQQSVLAEDMTESTAMIAVQGPKAVALVDPHVGGALGQLGYYRGVTCQFDGQEVICSRTGYTGCDGCELIVAADAADNIWRTLFDEGAPQGLRAAGLGARDTLRLEAGMPLYGHELTEATTPYDADLGFAVTKEDHEFVGREAVMASRDDASRPRRVGLRLEGKRPAREGCAVLTCGSGENIGRVTSGTVSPTLGYPIAMAYVSRSAASVGHEVEIDVRGHLVKASVVDLPFWKRERTSS